MLNKNNLDSTDQYLIDKVFLNRLVKYNLDEDSIEQALDKDFKLTTQYQNKIYILPIQNTPPFINLVNILYFVDLRIARQFVHTSQNKTIEVLEIGIAGIHKKIREQL